MYQIYTLTDPRDMQVYYVGMSKDPHRRYAMHLLNHGRQRTKKDMWIQDLRGHQDAPILGIIERLESKEVARNRESYWIQHYLQFHAPLTNMQNIGEQQAKDTDMNEMDIQMLLKNEGWTYRLRPRRQGKLYIYAARRLAGRVREIYIGALSSLEDLRAEEVRAKLSEKREEFITKK